MKTIVMLATVLAAVVAIPADTYDHAYDNFNAEELAGNEHLLKNFINCFLHKGPCTADGIKIRNIMPEAIRTSCAKCTPKQRQLVRTVTKATKAKLPELWNELVKKEDPKGEYKESFEKFLNSSD